MGILQYSERSGATQVDQAEILMQQFGRLNVLDDLIRLRATDAIQEPILAYPAPPQDGTARYEYFTGENLDCMIDQTVCSLMNSGYPPPKKGQMVVALLTLSDLNMVVTFFALSRLGYTVMMLSPRLSAVACISLLDTVGCNTVMYGQTTSIRKTIGDILQHKAITCRPIVQRLSPDEFDNTSMVVLHRNRNRETQRMRIALILHSSGSTGTPKPLFLSHKALMTHPLRGPGLTSFNTLPWYHLHGLSTALQAMYMRKVAYMWDASLPLTTASVVGALEAAKPESVQGVPYLLQLLADSSKGIEALRSCKLVTYGGAPCPDDLGDRLVAAGVHFGGSFGLTEAGLVAESISRPQGDTYWNYLRFFDNLRQHIWMKPIGNDLYECVFLEGHPALTTSNSDDPPGSYHSRDVFAPHPTLPGRWKYISRLDDRITLSNGEKVLPLPIEGSIKQSPLVEEAVVVGVDRAAPGLLLFRSEQAQPLSDEQYLESIWPAVADANSRAEQFSQIPREMIIVLPPGSALPQTDKGSMIRAQIYTRYADEIEGLYTQLEQAPTGTLQLDKESTEAHLGALCMNELGVALADAETDFFAAGIDSLKSIHLRRLILQHFKIYNTEALSRNAVFEAGNISRLAAHVHAIQAGQITASEDHKSAMQSLVGRYSSFKSHVSCSEGRVIGNAVILTGATGSIGVHVLYRLLNDDTVSTVYCLTRRDNPREAVLDALRLKDLDVPPDRTEKIVALKTELHITNMGLADLLVQKMRQTVSLIVHSAWPVNFTLPLSSFEPHIQGLKNLIDLSLSVTLSAPAMLLFCSSISTALGSPEAKIVEGPTLDLSCALDMGYARSKLVGEAIVSNARKSGARAFSLRIGQVSGHSKKGLWNDSEAIPLMIRSALTLKALPDLDTTCSWLPADKLACSLLEIARACSLNSSKDAPSNNLTDDSIYNLSNPRHFSWATLLDVLRQQGFVFETVPFKDWLEKLRESEVKGEELVNPAVKLVAHYEASYGGTGASIPKTFITAKAERDSATLRNGRLRIVEDGILARLTCRTRHRKCDEQKPQCGPCLKSERECNYPTARETSQPANAPDHYSSDTQSSTQPVRTECSASSNPARIQNLLSPTLPTPHGPIAPTLDYANTSRPSLESHNILDPELLALYPDTRPQPEVSDIYPQLEHAAYRRPLSSPSAISPDVNGDHASTRWLDLLATDAAQAGTGFSLPTSPTFPHSHLESPSVRYLHEHTSSSACPVPPGLLERRTWQRESDIALSKQEAALFRRFADQIAVWLDLFDPHKHFTNYATRLAMQNTGLMKAILALAARYVALSKLTTSETTTLPTDGNEAIHHYNETLHYVSTALQYTSYKQSEELLATAIIISTYEMLDASKHNSNWQRHLKGVFWIQRSQDINADSTGLRRTVWWIWLTQDLWAAFRERRRCFSFWRPTVDYAGLSSDDLAYRSVYLLSQAVNYCAEPADTTGLDAPMHTRWRTERGIELMDMLERWKAFSSSVFKVMPAENRESVHGWAPIWIHPPSFGVALQMYSFARILVCLHQPVVGAFSGYRTIQKTLNNAVATIVGIAMELIDPGFQILSAQCLFGAGLCIQDEHKQETIISLIQACETRTGWPMTSMMEDLRKEWGQSSNEERSP
ncbi:hypothetical protein BJY04DRAFT_227020 [Aspergillus karnatakaensis]|uniref:uncharacterized protein n=1 Tax=Aspergillus karnatakaensis TaxID=1810916 RepID=UPI003CCDF8F9